jgi:predicted GTPase
MNNERIRKENNFKQMKNAFEQSQKELEKVNIEESEYYIEKYISNVFLKEFEIENNNEVGFKTSLISLMKNFTQEYMNFCDKFINTFKLSSEKIINEFDIKNNNPIEHINFIVIGRAGVGKSSFINESLLLSEEKRAKEGVGVSVTMESNLYTSDKLKMIRMWDTQGLDYKISQKYILNEIKRLVESCRKMGPDHYINIILYCTPGAEDRFQNEDGQLISEIMRLYPLDNLPVVITQLQSYLKTKAKKMEKTIRNVLENYLEHELVEKIEIKSVVARDYKDEENSFKAYGIPELLRLSFDIMGRSISSATCQNIIDVIVDLCKKFMDKKILYIKNLFKYEMELLEVAKNLFVDDLEEEEVEEEEENENNKKQLSEHNFYGKIENPNFFVDNFYKIIRKKFLKIYKNLESGNMNINEIENEEEYPEQEDINEINELNDDIIQENNNEINNQNENIIQENNNEINNQNENIEQNNIQNENNQNENIIEENNDEINNQNNNIGQNNIQNENNQENQVNQENDITTFIKRNLEKLRKSIEQSSNKAFEKVFKKRYDIYLDELRAEQSEKNRQYQDNTNILDTYNAEKNFRDKLFPYFKNSYFKIFFCIILKHL